MKVVCISASNILHSNVNSVSKILCDKIAEILKAKNIECEMIDLRSYSLHPYIGCPWELFHTAEVLTGH